ncbi:MAG: hypothetical protein ACRD3M_07795 [Thermoanaerobaculia bacterium]
MRRRFWPAGLLAAGALAAAAPICAQFVPLSRCHSALPCSRPFGLQYRPDPLIAGPWASAGSSAVSVHVELKENPKPELDRPKPPPVDDPVEASVRYFLRKHPAPKPGQR